jgi:hypothetical protein
LTHHTIAIVGLLAGLIPALQPASAQPEPNAGEETRTRQIWNEAFLQKRPGAVTPVGKAEMPGKAPAGPSQDLGDSLVGITVWRAEGQSWKRVAADSPLAEGQRVRIGIETARTGYLYVINREQYAGGAMGDPVLIFPTLRIRGGDNQVGSGRLVEIPAWSDSPPYFTLTRGQPDQVGEVLTLLVTHQPLPDVKLGADAVKLSPQQVAGWEKQWARGVRRLAARDDAGQLYRAAEREAGTQTRMLQHTDPLPQTLFLCDAGPDKPLLLSFPLQIAK